MLWEMSAGRVIKRKIDIDIKISASSIHDMIIPVKCFTCGKVINNTDISSEVRKMKSERDGEVDKVKYLTTEQADKTPEESFRQTKLNKMCCRRHILTHVDVE